LGRGRTDAPKGASKEAWRKEVSRKYRRRAHPLMILAHSLTSEFFGIGERGAYWPDFESFTI
jgi:predicted alpha/beta hydrolase family esterase